MCKDRLHLELGTRCVSTQCNHELLMAHMASIVVATSCHDREREWVRGAQRESIRFMTHDHQSNTVLMLWTARRYRLTACLPV